MTEQEALDNIRDIPIGAKLQLIKKNGDIVQVQLASHDVSGTEKKEYGELVVPALPPAITVVGGTRFGKFRIDVEDLVSIAWVD